MTVEFPPRPTENSDPWYLARETYDAALESAIQKSYKWRGTLDGPVHIDDMYGSDYFGIWHVNLESLPEGFPYTPTQGTLLECLGTGYFTGQKQIITDGYGTMWREAATEGSWLQWHRVLSDRIIKDPNDYMPRNTSAVLVKDEHTAFDFEYRNDIDEEFDFYTTGDTSDWLVYPNAEAFENGGQLSYYPRERSFALWNRHGTFSDGEVLIRASMSHLTSTTSGVAGLRLTTNQSGYAAGFRVSSLVDDVEFRIVRFHPIGSDPVAVSLIYRNVEILADQVYYIRFRAEGPTLSAKFWLYGDSEPDNWMLQTTDSTYTEGAVGVGKLSGLSTSRFNYIAVNSAGGTA